jgi:hypothetical protein
VAKAKKTVKKVKDLKGAKGKAVSKQDAAAVRGGLRLSAIDTHIK